MVILTQIVNTSLYKAINVSILAFWYFSESNVSLAFTGFSGDKNAAHWHHYVHTELYFFRPLDTSQMQIYSPSSFMYLAFESELL